MSRIFSAWILLLFITIGANGQHLIKNSRNITIPTIDISGDSSRQAVIAQGTAEIRNGHPNAIFLKKDSMLYVTWTLGHGGPCGFLKKSGDLGKTWSDLLEVPDNWKYHSNCPAMYNLKDNNGGEAVVNFVSRGPFGKKMYSSFSYDGGKKWSSYEPVRISGSQDTLSAEVMPFTSIVPIENGSKLLGVTNTRRPYEGGLTNILVQSVSTDGGKTWGHWRFILDLGDPFIPCEPEIIRSPDGRQLLMLIRENNRSYNSWIMVSDNEGTTWSEPYQAAASVTMDRHQHRYLPDGRLIVVGRDVAENSQTKGHFVGWIGRYEDLLHTREGEYRVKLLHTFKTTEYPSVLLLPDNTVLAINSVAYRKGENYSVVATKFNISELDKAFNERKK